jgi:hypothetical protein
MAVRFFYSFLFIYLFRRRRRSWSVFMSLPFLRPGKARRKKQKKMALCLVNNMGRETNVEERKKE